MYAGENKTDRQSVNRKSLSWERDVWEHFTEPLKGHVKYIVLRSLEILLRSLAIILRYTSEYFAVSCYNTAFFRNIIARELKSISREWNAFFEGTKYLFRGNEIKWLFL